MPYVDLPNRNLSSQYYTINPVYSSIEHSLVDPPPPSDEKLDDRLPIVFVHAGTSSSEAFINQFQDARLRTSFNLVSFDSRYYGRTTGSQLDYFQDLEERAEELLDAIDAVLGDRPFVVFGESFVGAHCCVHAASRRPKQVRAIVMLSPSYFEDSPEMIKILENEWLPWATANKDGQGDKSGDMPEGALEVAGDYFFGTTDRCPERRKVFLERYQYNHGGQNSAHKLQQLLHWFKRKPVPKEVFERIQCPTLIFLATEDKAVSPDDAAQQWYDALVNVDPEHKRIERIHGGTHLLATTDHNIVNRVTLKFLQR
ncbi:alpha/beta fold hydrolase, partial [Sporobolomyces salmoneus]|uniref:alpha/beta fold hydrolase n=1 Tax=Sporobolomyces salmoneus TaxID=183962 RepID=UPI00317F78BF